MEAPLLRRITITVLLQKMQQFKKGLVKKLIEFAADDTKRAIAAFFAAIAIYLGFVLVSLSFRTPPVRGSQRDLHINLAMRGDGVSDSVGSAVQQSTPPLADRRNSSGRSETVSDGGIEDYRTAMLARIYRHRLYPPEAIDGGIQGNVRLHFTVQPDGAVAAVGVDESPHPLLARASVEAVRRSSPFPPLRSDKNIIFEVTLSFELDEEQ